MRTMLCLILIALLGGCGTVVRTTTSVVTKTVETATDIVTAPLP
ncbi:hypothetical protein [Roseiterribacter gracilis]